MLIVFLSGILERQSGRPIETLSICTSDLPATCIPLVELLSLALSTIACSACRCVFSPTTRWLFWPCCPSDRSRSIFDASCWSLVTTIPPSSGAARFLLGWKLKQPSRPIDPTRLPPTSAPCAWAASSTTSSECRSANRRISSMRVARP